MIISEADMIARMKVLRQNDQIIFAMCHEVIYHWHDLISIGYCESAAGTEIILNVNDD